MADTALQSRVLRFGTFELDLAAGELRKNGRKVRVQEQPFQLLTALVEKPGEVVTREELKDKLWPGDTYVDFDRSLNTAASKLRDALGDSASSPRFIETLPRRGYRFLASLETAEPFSNGAQTVPPNVDEKTSGRERRDRGLKIAFTTTLVLLLTAFAVIVALSPRPVETTQPPRVIRFSPSTPSNTQMPAGSPDGRHIAYVAGARQTLWIHDIDRDQSREIESSEGAIFPFWSPDSRFVGFGTTSAVKKVAVDGGLPIKLCEKPHPYFTGAAFSPDGTAVVYSSNGPRRLYEVSAQGGSARLLLERPGASSPVSLTDPFSLPADGRQLIFREAGRPRQAMILRDLDTGEESVLAPGRIRHVAYSPTEHILYEVAGSVWALPFSLDTREPTGEAFLVAHNATFPSVSADGTFVYLETEQAAQHRLVWRDRAGKELETIGLPQERILFPSLSPEGSRVAVAGREGGNEDVWIHSADRPTKTRLTFATAFDRGPSWSPDGKDIAFPSSRNGGLDIFSKPADGSGEAVPLLATPLEEFVTDWSKDGQYLLYDRHQPDSSLADIWYLKRKPDDSGFEPFVFLSTPFLERAAKFSPDGRYVVYASNETGEYEVYVRTFPSGEGKWQVSANGGTQPRWSRDGKEIFYGYGDTLFAVPVTLYPSFRAGTPEELFQSPGLWHLASNLPRYDVSTDGKRFVVREPVGDPPTKIRVVQNWYEEFGDRPEGDE